MGKETTHRNTKSTWLRGPFQGWARVVMGSAVSFGMTALSAGPALADSEPRFPNFTATVAATSATLAGNATLAVTLTVTQNGEAKGNETHSLPKNVWFEFFDGHGHWWARRGTLASPVSEKGSVGSMYTGTYSVPVPDPDTAVSGLNLVVDSFEMVDSNRRMDADDGVLIAQSSSVFGITPAAPNYVMSVSPVSSTVQGGTETEAIVSVTQSGDTEHTEQHALPNSIQLELGDSAGHSWTVPARLVSPVSGTGAVGYKYTGVYKFRVPNVSGTDANVTLRADRFYMVESHQSRGADDAVPTATSATSITLEPRSH